MICSIAGGERIQKEGRVGHVKGRGEEGGLARHVSHKEERAGNTRCVAGRSRRQQELQ